MLLTEKYDDDIPNYGQLPVMVDPDTPWFGYEILDDIKLVVQSIGDEIKPNEQAGSGIDIVGSAMYAKEILDYLPTFAAQLDTLAFGPVGTYISNTASEYYNKNPEWKPGFAGEKHLVLPTSSGLTRANFAGPGTHLAERLQRGDVGVDGPKGIDEAAKKHDIKYSLAKDYSDIRMADSEFIDDVRDSTQNPMLKNIVIGAIKAKNFGEDYGFLSKNRYLTEEQKKEFGGGSLLSTKEDTNKHSFKIIKDNRKKSKLSPAQLLLKSINKKKKKKPKK